MIKKSLFGFAMGCIALILIQRRAYEKGIRVGKREKKLNDLIQGGNHASRRRAAAD